MSRLGVFLIAVAIVNALVMLGLVRRHRLRAGYALLWIVVALAGVAGAVAVPAIDRIAEAIGVTGPSLFFLGAVLFLMIVAMLFMMRLTELERRSEILAQEVALLRHSIDLGVEGSGSSSNDVV